MQRRVTRFATLAVLLVPAHAAAQDLADRIAAAPAGAAVRFTFESKPGVCGDGDQIRVRRMGEESVHMQTGANGYSVDSDSNRRSTRECVEGPVLIELERDGARITSARASVGGEPRVDGIDLGAVSPAEAVSFLLSPATLTDVASRAADRMIFSSTLADAESWPSLMRIARMQELPVTSRKTAVFWVAQAAGDRATEGLRSIAGDGSDEVELRKSAVFAISQIRTDASIDALIEIARTNREPEIRRNAIFWLGQSGDPRALAFFEQVLRG